MTNYIDTLDSYDSPLLGQRGYVAHDMVERDPVRQIQTRMVLILALAIMVASMLSLLALPNHTGVGSGVMPSSEVAVVETSSNAGGAVNPPGSESDQTAALAGTGSQSSGIADFFTPEIQYWEDEIVHWANQHDVDPNAVATIMQIESCGNPQAVSVAGARGLFQVMPFHFSSGEDMLDPDTNARRGLDFLNEQLRYTGGDIFLSFAGYNGGYAASGGSYENWANETQRYYQWAKGIYEDASAGANESETLNTWLDAGGRPGCQLAASSLGL